MTVHFTTGIVHFLSNKLHQNDWFERKLLMTPLVGWWISMWPSSFIPLNRPLSSLWNIHFEPDSRFYSSTSQSRWKLLIFKFQIQGLGSQFGLVKQLFHSSVPGTLHRSIKIEIDSDNHCRSFLNWPQNDSKWSSVNIS